MHRARTSGAYEASEPRGYRNRPSHPPTEGGEVESGAGEHRPTRTNLLREVDLTLTQTNPLRRLQELCKAGRYTYHFKWDKFANGMMMTCLISYRLGSAGEEELIRRACFVRTHEPEEGKNVVASCILQSLDLAPTEDADDAADVVGEAGRTIMAKGMQLLSGVLDGVDSGEIFDRRR